MPNLLANETSPYLKQHADNPVDWHPWGEEALARAKAEDKPILLSIGYAACHWCHVMAHESFEDPAIAAIMNANFVNIKVDREERPDLDQVYQTAHSLLTRRNGGWPLTMFLTPDQNPFFGGTYFPPAPRHGLPGFGDLLHRVAAAYRENGEAIQTQTESLLEALALHAATEASPTLNEQPIADARDALVGLFDSHHGGFGGAPKFPHPSELAFVLERHTQPGEGQALHVVAKTLTHMAEGGIFDQLAGGFCRYSVDAEWSIPHFEKMLYDNGLLLALYADAYAATGNPLFAQTARATADWLLREMQSPEGGYYSSLDADSEHQEGKFYVWTREEVRALLSPAVHAVVAAHYGLEGPPNFEGEYWHLRVSCPLAVVANQLGISEREAHAHLETGRKTLLLRREKRVRPGCDDKILVSWNALAIIGLARASRIFDEPSWAASARHAFDFIRNTLWHGQGLLATYKDGRARLNAYVDDYAFLLAAVLELLQLTFRADDLAFAKKLADGLLENFEDREQGGFYFTSNDHERLIYRPKSGHDHAIPSGSGVGAHSLLRVGHVLSEQRYVDAAERTLQAFAPQYSKYPNGHCALLTALVEWVTPPTVVILTGPQKEVEIWRKRLSQKYHPHQLVLQTADASSLPPALARPEESIPVAQVCRGNTCLAPLHDLEKVMQLLQSLP